MNGACNYLWGSALIGYTILPFRKAIINDKTKRFRMVYLSMQWLPI